MTNPATHYRWDDIPREKVNDMLDRKLITGDRMMIAHVYLKKDCVVPKHSHENEQLTYILEGALRFSIGVQWKRKPPGGSTHCCVIERSFHRRKGRRSTSSDVLSFQ